MFNAYPTYSRYRTLTLNPSPMKGEDVFALQTALNHGGFPAGAEDGIFGSMTSDAVLRAQVALGLLVDGKAGSVTQRSLALHIAQEVASRTHVLAAALKGQMEHESGFRLGNYSPQRANGTYDAGVCQRNTQHTPAKEGFDVPESIDELAGVVRSHYNLFAGVGSTSRRWQLSQGAWNAPAFACYIAREEGASQVSKSLTLRPTDAQRV